MSTSIVLGIIILHYIADFILQRQEDAENKYRSVDCLLNHTIAYSLVMTIGSVWWIENDPLKIISFFFVTLIFHSLTDYITSRTTRFMASKSFMKTFWNVIGLDQVLHYVQLFLTIKYLNEWIL